MPDAVLLTEVATRLDRHSDNFRLDAATLVRATGECEWDGPAARRFRADALPLLHQLRIVTRQLSDAAELVLRSAR